VGAACLRGGGAVLQTLDGLQSVTPTYGRGRRGRGVNEPGPETGDLNLSLGGGSLWDRPTLGEGLCD
jgi:hypothetical protein